MENVELGEVVMLNSGGPGMTVTKIFQTNEKGQRVDLSYFIDNAYQVVENINVKSLTSIKKTKEGE